ncbi:HAD hydrolase family protein [Roseiconus nitratireducens]|uniref:3-deoxy-D-manno-octulosonate 8-phosphate phosphatase KdsC n=1 Tax=Roseiconus nitratireducens TaxID=2605748 RepID=A0A5M6D8F2_9BACT|nr:HAD hydrolase family protein [Roseiconus nitratireducens]KAA5543797.1 HAD hydrolase family protein [Roseiconus nitratireducens]
MPATFRSDSDLSGPITCILSDVDGVMTDGGIIYGSNGEETKRFHVRDGSGIKIWIRSGYSFGIITGRRSVMVDRRAEELGIQHVSQGIGDKLSRAQTVIAELGLTVENVCYIGDDLPDLELMKSVALAAAPADAAADARDAAHWVLRSGGGQGAVREVVERLLRAKEQWNPILA